jgi:hypothetical protein
VISASISTWPVLLVLAQRHRRHTPLGQHLGGDLEQAITQCFVDVFSCRRFDSEVAAAVAVAHFGGTVTLTVLHR